MKNLTNEEIENLSYDELAKMILENKKGKMKIIDIFKKICELKHLTDKEFEDRIADFYELISTNKEFIVLEKGFCDLRINHTPKVIIDDEESSEEGFEEEEEENNEDLEDEENDDIFYDGSSEEDDVTETDDELSDFVVVDEDEENNM